MRDLATQMKHACVKRMDDVHCAMHQQGCPVYELTRDSIEQVIVALRPLVWGTLFEAIEDELVLAE